MMILPTLTPLNFPKLIRASSSLPREGTLLKSKNNLIYLNIDDQFIHSLFPYLNSATIKKPNYFGKGLIGAHISVFYPEEPILFNEVDLKKTYTFAIKELIQAEMNSKSYFMLLIHCPELIRLRKKYGLNPQLNFKNYVIDLHITIGVGHKKH
ncbi:MAG: hypothetical protein PSV35_02700 [bacterium]|nr:hypothetical protein [bacterium]